MELPVGELVQRGPVPVLDPDGSTFEVELPTGELVERGPLPVVDGDADYGDGSYNNSSSRNNGTRAGVLAFPFDRGKRFSKTREKARIFSD